jgi:hypothetical protein
MDGPARFRLRVTAYTPDSIPLARLAEYMAGLAALMGSQAQVHLGSLTKGSTVINAEVEPESVQRVESRLRTATTPDAPSDAVKALTRLEALMREDNARGTLSRDGERLIKFLGIDAVVVERVGPVREATSIQGEVVRVGGKDRTLHALLVSPDGEEYKVTTTSREQAKALAAQLFTVVRATGTGVWYRSEAGVWELDELRLEAFEPVAERSLFEAVAELRSIGDNGWAAVADPLSVLRDMRRH